jgi:phosphoadenosine phosphosulfate reductase
MIEYYCESCDSFIDKNLIDKKTNKCQICRNKYERLKKSLLSKDGIDGLTLEDKKLLNEKRMEFNNSCIKLKTKLFWCANCLVPISNKICGCCGSEGSYISTDARPVFPEEQLLLNVVSNGVFPVNSKSVWYLSGNKYIVEGIKIEFRRVDYISYDVDSIITEFNERLPKIDYTLFNENISKAIKANQVYMDDLISESYSFIHEISSEFDDDEMFISFSGGKDSTTVDELVKGALRNHNIIKIFGDTTLEFPMTYDYVNRVKGETYNKEYSNIIRAKNRKEDFFELCEKIGPPSRLLRWCCTYFKTAPISDKIDMIFIHKKRVLTFYGIRRNESVSRSKYDMQTESPKISKQLVFSPIIDWLDYEVWLYLLLKKCDFNDAYRYGYSRVGCWLCPNNNDWASFLSRIFMPEESERWYKVLQNFAVRTDKTNPESYIKDNSWKARQGGNGIDISKNTLIEFSQCVIEPNTYNYELKRPIDENLYELFKPFGIVNQTMGNSRRGEVFIVSNNKTPSLRLQGKIGTNNLKVTIIDFKEMGAISKKLKNIEDAKKKVDNQLVKFQTCIACNGCKSVCKFDAIRIEKTNDEIDNNGNIVNNIKYLIDDSKCVRCGDCVDHFDGGCYMKKVLRIKKGQ